MADIKKLFRAEGFEWDKGNIEKNWLRHKVTPAEGEQIFFNQPLVIADDAKHSHKEIRYYALGQTDAGRLLFVVFTVRKNLIRIISARDMGRLERETYESHEEE